jgi:two-component system nitrate/nitrite sensor histidine kinase NarX
VSAEHERVVRVYADFAGVMLTGLRAREDDVARAVVDERSRLAREIHDGMAQQLAFLKMRVAWLKRSPHLVTAEQLGDVEAGLGGALAEARAAITTLRAQPGTAVSEMIANYAEEFAQVAGIAIDVRLSHDHIDLPPRAGVELLRIVQEALNNVRKHAHASRVSVDVEATGDGISVTVRDDGVGLTSDANPRGHFGTQIMAERAESIGGRCHLESTGDGGTSVHVWVPLPTAG